MQLLAVNNSSNFSKFIKFTRMALRFCATAQFTAQIRDLNVQNTVEYGFEIVNCDTLRLPI